MAERQARRGRKSSGAVLFVIPFLIVAVAFGVRGFRSSGPAAIDVVATGPRFATADQLVSASELIVLAEVIAEAPGRAVTDPTDPQSGILTTVFTLDVISSMALSSDVSQGSTAITLEYETALLDGTPITIDGIQPPAVGERGLFFLVGGPSLDFPHYGLVNDQGRYPLGSDRSLVATSNDPLVLDLAATPVDELWVLLTR